MKKNRNRVFILGAGFSKYAGLPLGDELLELIIEEAIKIGYYDILEKDLNEYKLYKSHLENIDKNLVKINFEDFMSYLDIEHFLRLKGSDTWSEDGNKSQILIRNIICKILFERQNKIDENKWWVYEEFVKNLSPEDIIITFNYDTILETCLKNNNILYRYYHYRLKDIKPTGAIVDRDNEEIIILKMHGSIDWFDISKYNESFIHMQNNKYFQNPRHIIFQNQKEFLPTKLEGYPFHHNSLLNNIYSINSVENYLYRCQYVIDAPLILSPSFSKIVYLNPLKDLWDGMKGLGYFNMEFNIIGFSFSDHDDYLRMPLINAIINFQKYNQLDKNDYLIHNLKIIDFLNSDEEIFKFKNKLNFIDWEKTNSDWNGFSNSSIDFLFK